ncbi:MAG: 7-cyano-7-deazaguanine synthase QueC [Candidatus Omnitrophica bacterium]|nr:7-cyano-7-deazaguanine synthase QueC [Candidatus Omnitrophota bacterium]
MSKAIVLLSGGLDSATTLYYARKRGFKVFCLIFDYGQRHKKEIAQAVRIAEASHSGYSVLNICLPQKGSALLEKRLVLPKGKASPLNKIPSTYVPSRNIVFLSLAASYAEVLNADTVFIGANAIDYSGYPDCRPEFMNAFQKALDAGTKAGVEGKRIKIAAPLINKTKSQIVEMASKLKVPLHLTWSCYRGGKRPCGVCDSCVLREKGFQEAGIIDPAIGK